MKPLYSRNDQTRLRALERQVEDLEKRTRGYTTVQDNGSAVALRDTLNFIGATVSDDSTNAVTDITLGGGGGGGGCAFATIDIGAPATFADTGYSLSAISMRAATFATNDSSVFDYTTVGGVTTIRGLVAGTYMAYGAAKGELFSAPAAGSMLQCYGFSTGRNPFIENRFCPWFDIDGFGDYEAGVSQGWMNVISSIDPPDRFIFRIGQNSGSSIQLHAYLQVVRIGDET